MRQIRTEDAVGQVLCHDMTQIIPTDEDGRKRFKGVRFRKGYVVQEEDIPVLLSMGKRNLYVWEMDEGKLHENDAAHRLAALCEGPGIERVGEPSEGKINLRATHDGVLMVDSERLLAVNSVEEVMVATRPSNAAVRAGQLVAGTRAIPLVVDRGVVEAAEAAAQGAPLMSVEPFKLRRAGIITTGSEVAAGLVKDRFTPVVEEKLAAFGVTASEHELVDDGIESIRAALARLRASDVDVIVCTGGMSVDPDDNTPGAIKGSGARVVTYGAPVLPGAMMLLGYYEGEFGHAGRTGAPGRPVLGLPGCVMYSKTTIFDLVLPRILAGVELARRDFVALGEGGLL